MMFNSIDTIQINPLLLQDQITDSGNSTSANSIDPTHEVHHPFNNKYSSMSLSEMNQQLSSQNQNNNNNVAHNLLFNQQQSQHHQPSHAHTVGTHSSISSSTTSHSSVFSAPDSQRDILSETNDPVPFRSKVKSNSTWEPYTIAQSNMSSSSVINNANINVTLPTNNSSLDKSLDFMDFSPLSFTDSPMSNSHRRQKSNFFSSSNFNNNLANNNSNSNNANESSISEISDSFDRFSLESANNYNFPNNSSNPNSVLARRNSDFVISSSQYNGNSTPRLHSRVGSTTSIGTQSAGNNFNGLNNLTNNSGNSISMNSSNLSLGNQSNQSFDLFQPRVSPEHGVSNNYQASPLNNSRHSSHYAKSQSLSLPSSNSSASIEIYRQLQLQQQSMSNSTQLTNSVNSSMNRPTFRRGNSIAVETDYSKFSGLVNPSSKRPASANAHFPNSSAQVSANGVISLHTINTSNNNHSNSNSSSGSPMYSPINAFAPMSAGSCSNIPNNNNNNHLMYAHNKADSITSLNHFNNSGGNVFQLNDVHTRRNTITVISSYNNNSSSINSLHNNVVIPNNHVIISNNLNNGASAISNSPISSGNVSSNGESIIPNNVVITNLTTAANAMTNNGSFALLNPSNNIGKQTRKQFRNTQQTQPKQADKDEASKKVVIEKDVLIRYKSVSIKQLESQILALSTDQNGCRFLQKRIEESSYTNTPKEVEDICRIIYRQVKTIIQDLITNSFGNYLVQKLFDHLTVDERTEILRICESRIKQIALNQHGTRALQHMIELLTVDEQIEIIIEQLKSHVIELIKNLNGNHVIQKCLVQFNNKKHIQFIVDGVCESVSGVASHRHGCCVLQKTLDYSDSQQFSQIGNAVLKDGLELLQDAYGNYVVQHLLSSSKHPKFIKQEFSRLVGLRIQGHLKNLSVQKYASNVVEKCIKSLDDEELQKTLILEVLELDTLKLLIRDPYGNYVVQAMLDIVLFNGMKNHAIGNLTKVLEDIPEDDVYARKIAHRVTDKAHK